MKIQWLHDWPSSTRDAKVIQEQFRHRVVTNGNPRNIKTVAGVDIGFEKRGTVTRAAVAVLSFPALELIEHQVIRDKTRFPYVPGYLSFREVPAALKAFDKLQHTPDLVLCDGQGIAHPRRFGLACHMGLWINIPTIGVAKSRLVGTHQPVGIHKGDWQPLMDEDETIGAVLRTRDNVRPLFVSAGHKIGLDAAIDYTLRCTTRYRLPETTRWADKLASGR